MTIPTYKEALLAEIIRLGGLPADTAIDSLTSDELQVKYHSVMILKQKA